LVTLTQLSDGKQGKKISKFKVSIYGNLIEELQPLLQTIKKEGTMIHQGKLLDSEDTVLS
jgi:hypothetical protein